MIIETAHLCIRPPKPADFDRFWGMVTDPAAKQYTGGVTKLTYAERRALFLSDCALPLDASGAEFAVTEKSDGRYLGYCGFRISEELAGNEFFYGYCRDAWGQGYGQEAASAVLEWLLANLPHHTYFATVVPANTASVKILKRLGFQKTQTWADQGLDVYRLSTEKC